MLIPKPTPHLTLTLTSEFGCMAGLVLKRKVPKVNKIMRYEISKPGRLVTAQTDLTRQWHIFSYTQRHYPIPPCEVSSPGTHASIA